MIASCKADGSVVIQLNDQELETENVVKLFLDFLRHENSWSLFEHQWPAVWAKLLNLAGKYDCGWVQRRIHREIQYRLMNEQEEGNREEIGWLMNPLTYFFLGVKTSPSYKDCFKGANLRRTEIACVTLISQGWCGERSAYNPTYFFSAAGLDSDSVYRLNLGSTAISFLCIFIAWGMMGYVGRRPIMIGGLGGMSICLLIIGCLAVAQKGTSTWVQAAFAMVWIAVYGVSIGPLAYTIVSEVSATRVRAPTISIARMAYNCINIIDKVAEPYLINVTKLNLQGKTAFVWFATNTLIFIWSIFRLPETKDRTYEELDVLFESRVSAWKF
jgi:hypothetical protein